MIYGDYHIHSTYSKDAISTIEENIVSAMNKGLKEIAISDHNYFHGYGIKFGDRAKINAEIERLKSKYAYRVLKSAEANLIDQSGLIDLSHDEQRDLDIVVLGYHKSYGKARWLTKFLPHIRMRRNDPKTVAKNTQAYITAMTNNKVNIVAHIGYGAKVNTVEIAKFCKEHNIFLELNGRKNCIPDSEMKDVIATGVQFILDSDAHNFERVGDVRLGLTIMEKYNIPEWQIANLNKLPDFTKRC